MGTIHHTEPTQGARREWDQRTVGNTLVEASGLGRRFGSHWALAHVGLEISRGQALLVAGANGAGKTTLLSLLAGLDRPTRGTLRMRGLSLDEDPTGWRRTVSMLGLDGFLYGRLTAIEVLSLWQRLLGEPDDAVALLALLDAVGLAHAAKRRVETFSTGMRKRLGLARIRLERPSLLLLDEPFAALDAAGQGLVEQWIIDHRREGGSTVIASHAITRCARLCDRALLLRQGQVAWTGPALQVIDQLEAAA